MKHDSPHSWGGSPCFGGMTPEIETTQIEIRDNAYWPDEALLTTFAEEDNQMEQVEQLIEENAEYAALYFIS